MKKLSILVMASALVISMQASATVIQVFEVTQTIKPYSPNITADEIGAYGGTGFGWGPPVSG